MKSRKVNANKESPNLNKIKLKLCYALYSFYEINKIPFKGVNDYVPVNNLDAYVKHRLLTGIESCCFNIGYITHRMMQCNHHGWVNGLSEIRKISNETSLLLNQLCDEMDIEFKDLGDGVNADSRALIHNLKNPNSPLKHIPTRYFGKAQDLFFDEFFESNFPDADKPTPLDFMWKATSKLCEAQCAIRYCEEFNRSKLYKQYKSYSDQMRWVAEIVSSIPDIIISYNKLIGGKNP